MHSQLINEKIIQNQIDEIIGVIIKNRKKKKITQEKLAQLTGVSRSTITRLESFDYIPTLPVMLSIFQALDITFDIK